MLKYISEFKKYVIITGFRNVKIRNIENFLKETHEAKKSDIEVQFLNADLVVSWQHLYFAALNALTAFKNKENISKSVAMETMLYASAQRQIKKGMELIGIKPDTKNIAVLIIGENPKAVKSALSMISTCLNSQNDGTVLSLSQQKMKVAQKIFGISDLELETAMRKDGLEEALVNLVIERMALLATQR